MIIETERGRLRPWRDEDLDDFAAMHADLEVMHDAAGPLTRAKAAAKLQRYRDGMAANGFSRMAMEDRDGAFLGYVGILPVPAGYAFGGVEIGWRFRRACWGQGYATEGARAALDDGFRRFGFPEVLAYTAPDNLRSQAVMERLGMARAPSRDFTLPNGWRGWVWAATP